jgi:hypothetical protein
MAFTEGGKRGRVSLLTRSYISCHTCPDFRAFLLKIRPHKGNHHKKDAEADQYSLYNYIGVFSLNIIP